MAVEKSAVLPDAGGANSAAPTVQSGGKPLKVSSGLPAGLEAQVAPAPDAASDDVGASVRSSIDHLRPGFLRPSEQLDVELAAREQHVIERFAEIG